MIQRTILLGSALIVGAMALQTDPAWSGEESELRLWGGEDAYWRGIAWQYAGVTPPDYGAFAVRYFGAAEVTANVYLFNREPDGGDPTKRMDAYVWDDAGGMPGAVLCAEFDVDPGPIPTYLEVTRVDVPLSAPCAVGEEWWVGFWADWPGQRADWWVAESLLLEPGASGAYTEHSYTKIAPGQGFPTGWSRVSTAWGVGMYVGIGALVQPLDPTPVVESSWGQIKQLYK